MMKTNSYQDHCLNPRNHEVPAWFNIRKSYHGQGPRIVFYLDIEPHGLIKSFHYQITQEGHFREQDVLPFLSALAQILSNKKSEEVLLYGQDIFDDFFVGDPDYEARKLEGKLPFFPLTLALVHRMLEDHCGTTPPYNVQMNQQEKDLVCLCFGVYRGQIVDAINTIQAEGEVDCRLRDVTQATRAGAGCTGCVREIQMTILEKRFTRKGGEAGIAGPKATGARPKKKELMLAGLTPVQLVVKFQSVMDEWVKEKFAGPLASTPYLEIMGIKEKSLLLKAGPPQLLQEMEESLPMLKQKLGGALGNGSGDDLFTLTLLHQ